MSLAFLTGGAMSAWSLLVDKVHLRTNWPGMPLETALTGMRLFAHEVAPRFRDRR